MRVFAPILALAITSTGPTSRPATDPLPAPDKAPDARRWNSADTIVERLATAAERAAGSREDVALAHLYRLTNFGRLIHRPERIRASLDRIAKSGRGLVRDHARYLGARHDRRRGDLANSRAEISALGFLTSGLWIGPFDNAAGRGHEEVFAPEVGIDVDSEIRGKGHAVSWTSFNGLAPDGNIELSAFAHPAREATVYVAAVIASPRVTRAALRTGSIGQLAVFVNGQKVYDHDTRRDAHPDQDAIPIVLARGDNLVLIKSSWLDERGRLFARVTAPAGGALNGVSWVGDVARIKAAAARSIDSRKARHRVVAVSDGVDRALKRTRGAARADVLALRADLFAVMSLFDTRKLPTPPEVDLEAAVRLSPNDPAIRFFYAHRVRARDPNLALAQWEAVLQADPAFVPALLEIADAAQRSGRVLEAARRIDAAIAADPTLVESHVARARVGYDSLSEDAVALLRLRATPGFETSPAALTEAARLARTLNNRADARRDVTLALQLDRDRPLARYMAIDLALDADDTEGALEQLDRMLELRPHRAFDHTRRARILAGVDRTKDALAALARAKTITPGSPAPHRLEAELALFANDKTRAIAALDRALELDAQQPEVRRHRRALSGDRQELEDEYSIDAKALAAAPISDDERRWGAIYLADRGAIQLFGNGKSTRFEQFVIRLRNPRLEDAVRAQRISYSPSREVVEILSAERIRPSGEVEKATNIRDNGPRGKVSGMYVDQRFKQIAFDDLEAGDLVHIRYRVDSAGDNIFGGFFGDVEALQAGIPKRNVEYTVIAPKSRPLFASTIRTKAPERTEKGEQVVMRWRYDEVPAIEIEPFSPPYPQLGSMVSVSTYETWNDLGQWYARLYKEQLELDEAARSAGRRVVQGAKSDDEKIRRLYDYVVKNTRYVGIELGIHGWKPFKASEVHRRRYGDCKDKATLLSALLRDNGVNATITLVRTSDRGILPDDHATMWAFNHAITYVPSKELFLDPTAEFSGSTELPYQDQGAMALIVHPDGRTKLTRLPESGPTDNRNESSYVAKVSRDTQLAMSGEERFFGARASALRRELEEKEKRKTILERQLGQVLAGAKINGIEFSDLSDIEAPVRYQYDFSVPRYGRVEGDRLMLPVALYRHEVARAYAQLATRKHALHINHPWSTTNEIRYEFPKGAKVEQLPKSVTVQSKHISLVQEITRVDGGFTTKDTVSLTSKTIPPEDYEEFRKACLAIDRALERAVVIRW